MKKKTTLFLSVFLIIGLSFTWAAGQQDAAKKDGLNFPTRPIKLVVPWSPGGSTDAMARALSSISKQYLGVEMNVVNRDGAGGTIATTELMSEKPDGYTIMINAVGVMTTQPVLRKVAYKIEDFDYLTGLSYEPIVLAINTSSPYKSVDDLKKSNKTIMLGANAVGSLPYIAALAFMHKAGIKAEAVPMAGGGPSIAALLGKQVDVGAFHPNEAVQHVGTGDLKYICVASPERMKEFPDVPTSAELGVPLDYSVWKWLQTPKGVDPKILAFLEEKLKAMKADPKFQDFAKKNKLVLIDVPGAEVKKSLISQAAATSEAIHNIGIK